MKKLHLSQTDKKIFGICGGIAEYFDVDSTLVRLFAVIVAILSHLLPAILVYILAYFVIPKKTGRSA